LAVVDQLDHLLLEGVFLVLPPFPKEGGFDLDVASVGVAYQGFNRRAYYVLDSGVLDVFLRSVVVLVDGFEPTDIVVRVRDQMDVDFFYIYGVASLEMLMEALLLFLMGLT
jgi:hypothetical protein